jgi:hypothetical protein
MPDLPEALLRQLLDLIDQLRRDTRGFVDKPGDRQLWYDRGYANGMILALRRLGQPPGLGDRLPDDPDELGGQLATPWGKAYRHGEAMGSRETHEITGTQSS